MIDSSFFTCAVCKKSIGENAIRCPTIKRLVHTGCMHAHIRNCQSFHKKFIYWGAAAYTKKTVELEENLVE